jgi:preprotein translocase subunit SecF
MEIFKQTNYDFLGKKWPFIIASLILTLAGVASLFMKGGPKYGIDFTGGALMEINFKQRPSADAIRSAVRKKVSGEIEVQEISNTQEVLINTEGKDEKQMEQVRRDIIDSLNDAFGDKSGKVDVNNIGQSALADALRDPLQKASVPVSEDQLQALSKSILAYRDDTQRSGLIRDVGDLSSVPGVTPSVLGVLKDHLAANNFAIRRVEIVGPKIGADLRGQAVRVVLYALAAMLIYIAFRFEWIYGVAAVIAVFHDTIITIGLFSLFNKQIDLTVIAALLTLVGYSMNDTIVVFDRIRENLKLQKRGTFSDIVNTSINQTLSRTILTSGLTLLTALALFFFGGQVLSGFSFALVVGIIVGTYSSVFIASPILIFWYELMEKRRQQGKSGKASSRITVAASTKRPAKVGK